MVGSAFLFQNCAAPPLDAGTSASDGSVVGNSRYRLPNGGATGSVDQPLGTSVTCTASVSATMVAAGAAFTYTISSSATLPNGFRVYPYGTKNGIPDSNEVVSDFFSTTMQSYTNPGYLGGTYTRSFQVRDTSGRAICQTNTVTVSLAGPSCTLSTPTPNLRNGSLMILNIAYGAGTVVPTDKANVQFNGTNNGLTIAPVPYDGTSFTTYNRVMNTTDVGNGYVRRVTIRNADTSIYCETNSVRMLVTP